MLAALYELLGAAHNVITRTFDFPGAEELGNMFQVKRDFQEANVGARDLYLSRTLNPGIKTFDDWLEKYGDQLPPGS